MPGGHQRRLSAPVDPQGFPCLDEDGVARAENDRIVALQGELSGQAEDDARPVIGG